MRLLICLILLASGCSEEPDVAGLNPGLFAGTGRDALCVAGDPGSQRAGFITYSADQTNCSARGAIVAEGKDFFLVPSGEGECRIPLQQSQGGMVIGQVPGTCAYYCGPGAVASGKSFRRVSPGDAAAAASNPMVDLGGDPLC